MPIQAHPIFEQGRCIAIAPRERLGILEDSVSDCVERGDFELQVFDRLAIHHFENEVDIDAPGAVGRSAGAPGARHLFRLASTLRFL
jgi:hypothetical protein